MAPDGFFEVVTSLAIVTPLADERRPVVPAHCCVLIARDGDRPAVAGRATAALALFGDPTHVLVGGKWRPASPAGCPPVGRDLRADRHGVRAILIDVAHVDQVPLRQPETYHRRPPFRP